MTAGAIAGIIVSIALLIILATAIFLYLKNDKKKDNNLNKDELLKKQKKIQEAKTQEMQEEKIKANVDDIDKTLNTIKKMNRRLPNEEIENQDVVIMHDGKKIEKYAVKSKKPIKKQNITNYYNNKDLSETPLTDKKSFLTDGEKTNKIINVAYLNIVDALNEDEKTQRNEYIPELQPFKDGYIKTINNDKDRNEILANGGNDFDVLQNFKNKIDDFFNGINNDIDTIKININCVGIKGEQKNTLKSLTGEQIEYLIQKTKQSGKKINISNHSNYGATICKGAYGYDVDLIELLQKQSTQPIIYTSISDKTKKYTKELKTKMIIKNNIPIKYNYNVWKNNKITLLFKKNKQPKVINNQTKKQLLGEKKIEPLI